jgi:hypothetical protein
VVVLSGVQASLVTRQVLKLVVLSSIQAKKEV